MPKKSVREMSSAERLHYSLAARTFHSVIMGAALLGLVALLIGLGLYTYALAARYVSEAFHLSLNAALILEKMDGAGLEELSDSVMSVYRGMTEEERAASALGTEFPEETEAYFARFAEAADADVLASVRSVLGDFLDSGNASAIYAAMYDRDTSAMVYIADPDPDPENVCRPGYWESVERSGMEKFLSWDGKGMLYDVGKTQNYGWLCTSGVPVKDASGRTVCFILSDITLGRVAEGMKSFLLQYFIAMTAAVLLLGFVMTRHMKRTLVQPINEISEAAQRYAADRRAGAPAADHFARLNIRTGDEVENLSLVMADMEQELAEYVDDLTRITAEKERISTELALATRIQAHMLPNIYPPFPERRDIDIYASMRPAKEVGGDFFDFFLIDDGHLGIVMADVSGKGIPAALFMMASKILVQNFAMTGRSPGEVLETVNTQICRNNREEMFVTIWFGILDLESGLLTAANAGHEYPVLRRPGGNFEFLKDRHGLVIGAMDGAKYKEYEIMLEPGAKLFLYTDGVPEASNPGNGMFGMDRMLEALRAAQDAAPRQVLEQVDMAVERFIGSAPQFDDLTMLCLHYSGPDGKGDERMKELTVPAVIGSLDKVTAFVNEQLESADCSMRTQMQIDVAVDEIFANIASYAYAPGTGVVKVRVEMLEAPAAIVITFIDTGRPFDPMAREDPDVTLSAEERQIGGLGIFLAKKTMDDMRYEFKNGQNILRIVKQL